MVVGMMSLLLWPQFTWSLGLTGSPSRRVARVAMTSLAFILELVPEPVWKISTGKCGMKSPSSKPWAASTIALPCPSLICLRSTLTLAAATLARISARMNGAGMRWWLIGKLFTARWVCAPYKASAGTCSSPMLSRSIRLLLTGRSLHPVRNGNRRQQFACRQLPGKALPALEATGTAGEVFKVAQRAPGLVQTLGSAVPRQGDVGGGVDQQAEGRFSDRPRMGRGATRKVSTFIEIMFDQARLIGIEATANLTTHPAPAFQVRVLMQDCTHDPHSFDMIFIIK